MCVGRVRARNEYGISVLCKNYGKHLQAFVCMLSIKMLFVTFERGNHLGYVQTPLRGIESKHIRHYVCACGCILLASSLAISNATVPNTPTRTHTQHTSSIIFSCAVLSAFA